MIIYIITEIQSNICEVKTKAFKNYNTANQYFKKIYKKHKKICKLNTEFKIEDKNREEYGFDKNNKHFSYDDGTYYISIDFNSYII